MLEKFGLNEQAQLKKAMEDRADEQRNKPFAMVEAVKQKADEAVAPMEDMEQRLSSLDELFSKLPAATTPAAIDGKVASPTPVQVHSNAPPIKKETPTTPPLTNKFCSNCGFEISAGSSFCANCGERLG